MTKSIFCYMISFILVFYIIFRSIDAKLDYTKEKKLLLWYSEMEDGIVVRKFIILFDFS
jgi:hypothetical protein